MTGVGRSAEQINEEIRQLWERSGGSLSPEQVAEYRALLVEWAAAQRAEHSEQGLAA